MDEKYTIMDVLKIIKGQLETIPVNGPHVYTMAAVFGNIDAITEALKRKESEAVTDGGTV